MGQEFICVGHRIPTVIWDLEISRSRPCRAGWTKARTSSLNQGGFSSIYVYPSLLAYPAKTKNFSNLQNNFLRKTEGGGKSSSYFYFMTFLFLIGMKANLLPNDLFKEASCYNGGMSNPEVRQKWVWILIHSLTSSVTSSKLLSLSNPYFHLCYKMKDYWSLDFMSVAWTGKNL